MAYGVNCKMMNDQPSYFERRADLYTNHFGEGYEKALILKAVCWWDPNATAEHVPRNWSKIDLALYHG